MLRSETTYALHVETHVDVFVDCTITVSDPDQLVVFERLDEVDDAVFAFASHYVG